jgi:hypothetical protein
MVGRGWRGRAHKSVHDAKAAEQPRTSMAHALMTGTCHIEAGLAGTTAEENKQAAPPPPPCPHQVQVHSREALPPAQLLPVLQHSRHDRVHRQPAHQGQLPAGLVLETWLFRHPLEQACTCSGSCACQSMYMTNSACCNQASHTRPVSDQSLQYHVALYLKVPTTIAVWPILAALLLPKTCAYHQHCKSPVYLGCRDLLWCQLGTFLTMFDQLGSHHLPSRSEASRWVPTLLASLSKRSLRARQVISTSVQYVRSRACRMEARTPDGRSRRPKELWS